MHFQMEVEIGWQNMRRHRTGGEVMRIVKIHEFWFHARRVSFHLLVNILLHSSGSDWVGHHQEREGLTNGNTLHQKWDIGSNLSQFNLHYVTKFSNNILWIYNLA